MIHSFLMKLLKKNLTVHKFFQKAEVNLFFKSKLFHGKNCNFARFSKILPERLQAREQNARLQIKNYYEF